MAPIPGSARSRAFDPSLANKGALRGGRRPREGLVLPGIPRAGDAPRTIGVLERGESVSVPVGVGGVDEAEFETVEEREVGVFRWRLDELLRAGYSINDALTLTAMREVDLHLAVELPRRGCPPATAARILL